MFKNYLKTAVRYLLKYKIAACINILGLATGIACFIVIGLYIIDEVSYDRQSTGANNVYRVTTNFINDVGFEESEATTPPALGTIVKNNIPEVKDVVRLFVFNDHNFYVRSGNNKFFEPNICHADTGFFRFFNVKIVEGDEKTVLNNPDAVVVSSTLAKKYFGDADPVGKQMEIDDWGAKTVSGVMEDIPEQTHFKADIIVPLKRFLEQDADNNWNWLSFYIYVKVSPGSNADVLIKKINAIHKQQQPQNKNSFLIQELTDIHLTSHLKYELSANSDILYIYILGTVGILVLLVSCINYINLTTSFSFYRTKEIGVRKINGASRKSLILQFLVESIFVSVVATALAFFIVGLYLPFINEIVGKNLQLMPESEWLLVVYVLIMGVLIGFVSGIYPAFYLTLLKPVKILKGQLINRPTKINLRKFFLTAQFAVSIALIFGMIVIMQQVDFLRNIRLGLNKDNVIVVNDLFILSETQRVALKNEWRNVKGVEQIAAADGVVGALNWSRDVRYTGSENNQRINFLSVDSDFIKVLKIELEEGRNLSFHYNTDSVDEVILNETGVKELAIPSPVIGQQITWRIDTKANKVYYATIVGVVKDFHFASMKDKIKPFAFVVNPKRAWNYTIRLDNKNISQTLTDLKRVWDANVKEIPFKYVFLNDTFSDFYKSEIRFRAIFRYITIAVIFISCIGLFGLSVLVIHQRNKEIGIRKTLGASVGTIAAMLSKEFFSIIVIASIITFPVAWWAIQFWLRDFVYRVDVSIGAFIIAVFCAFALVCVTIGFQTIKAAMANPVKALKTE